jgi:hypothetical protein
VRRASNGEQQRAQQRQTRLCERRQQRGETNERAIACQCFVFDDDKWFLCFGLTENFAF